MRPIAATVIAELFFCAVSPSWGQVPANDMFSQRVELAGFPTSCSSNNAGAGLEENEEVPEDSYSASVWYSWTAPNSAAAQIDLFGSDFDTALAVWTNTDLEFLELVAHNDDFGGSRQSAVFMDVVGGTTYQIAVYGIDGVAAGFNLSISNDNTGRIEGQVVGPGTQPIEQVEAAAHVWNESEWIFVHSAYSDAEGRYSLRGLAPGTYRLELKDWTGNYIHEFHENAVDLTNGTDIVLEASAMTASVDAELEIASKISGTVLGEPDSSPLADVLVVASQWNGAEWIVAWISHTDSSGYYQIGGLRAGTYRVTFEDWNGDYLTESMEVMVAEASHVEDIDVSLARAASIGGSVCRDQDGLVLSGIRATAYRWDGEIAGWNLIGTAQSDEAGNFLIAGLDAGTYRVAFADDENGQYVSEVFDNAFDLDSGTNIVVEAGGSTNVAVRLAAYASISGNVFSADGLEPLAGIEIYAYAWNGAVWSVVSTSQTDGAGSYELTGLSASSYRVGFFDPGFIYAAELYDDHLWTGEEMTGDDVVVGQGVSGIDAILASVSGQIGQLSVLDDDRWAIEFVGIAGYSYVLQAATAVTGEWADVDGPVVIPSATNSWIQDAPGPQMFWRIKPADFH